MYTYLAIAAFAYLIGTLPLAKWTSFAFSFGGNLFGPRYIAFIRVCTDLIKGGIAVAIGHEAGMTGAQLATLCVFLGHIFPLHSGFGYQNGAGTLLGALIVMDQIVGLTALSSWMFAYYVYRHSGHSAITSACLTTLIGIVVGFNPEIRIELLILLTIIMNFRHRRYIQIRL